MNILIKQGRVLDPASKTDKVMDVLQRWICCIYGGEH